MANSLSPVFVGATAMFALRRETGYGESANNITDLADDIAETANSPATGEWRIIKDESLDWRFWCRAKAVLTERSGLGTETNVVRPRN